MVPFCAPARLPYGQDDRGRVCGVVEDLLVGGTEGAAVARGSPVPRLRKTCPWSSAQPWVTRAASARSRGPGP